MKSIDYLKGIYCKLMDIEIATDEPCNQPFYEVITSSRIFGAGNTSSLSFSVFGDGATITIGDKAPQPLLDGTELTYNASVFNDTNITLNAGESTIYAWGYECLNNIIPIPWVDLRLGGDTLTTGNAPGNDIRYDPDVLLIRDADGMQFDDPGAFQSVRGWVKFEFLQWNRGEDKTLEWIIAPPTNDAIYIGVGSTATIEDSTTDKRAWAETVSFFTGGSLNNHTGNNGIPGAYATVTPPSGTFSQSSFLKAKYEQDGGFLTVYELPSSSDADWDDESTPVVSGAIALTPDEPVIMPFIMPSLSVNYRMLAIRVS